MAALLTLSLGWTGAQEPLPAPAAEALQVGQQLASQAQLAYDNHFPDQPLWAQALEAGRRAAAAAPEHPSPQRFLAQAYGMTNWYSRAWQAWQAYLDLGGDLDAAAGRQLLEAALYLGITTFDSGRLDEALPYLETVVRLDVDELRAHERIARLHLARGDPAAALPSLQAMGEDLPDDLLVAREGAEWAATFGALAADAFIAGRVAAAGANWALASERFTAATDASPDFPDAWRGRARAAAALTRPGDAAEAWQRVLRLVPGDEEATAGLDVARLQVTYGVAAHDAFVRGRAAYDSGALAMAREAFLTATAANPAYTDAHAWLGRIALENGDLGAAVDRYRIASTQAPARADLRQALAVAETRLSAAEASARATRDAVPEPPAATDPTAAPQAPGPAPATAPEPATPDAGTTVAARPPQPQPPAPAPSPVVASPAPDVAGELVLIDTLMTHRAGFAGGSGAFSFLDLGTTASDLTPFVGGRLLQRLEVRQKPTDAPVIYQVCIVTEDIRVPPACSQGAAQLRVVGTGAYESSSPLAALSGADAIDWGRGAVQLMLVLRADDGEPIDDRLLPPQAERSQLDPLDYFPMEVRFTAILLAPGATPSERP